jgi:ABC-type multidrug transport system fused ATPase/permease subunit
MIDVGRLLQAFVAPAIFVSATALLLLSVNVRLMGIVSRLRQFVHEKYNAEKTGRQQEAEAYNAQIASIEKRAEMIRQCFLSALISLAGSISACLLLGLGLYVHGAAIAAAMVMVAALIFLLLAVLHYIREVRVALSSVRDEARDLRFMDLGISTEQGRHHTI